MNLAKDKE